MIHRDEHDSSLPNAAQPLIPGQVGPGDALVPFQSNGMPASIGGFPGGPSTRAPDVLNGGMDHRWLFHSLRRRWILALGMGLVVGAAFGGVMWLLFPTSSTAVALFHVAATQPNLVFDDLNFNSGGKYETFQKTQLTLLKSNFVLVAALRALPANLNVFAGLGSVDNKVQWLNNQLGVQFPQGSEILQISLSGDEDPEELRKVVDAVAKAYEEEVVHRELNQRIRTKDVLSMNLSQMNDTINKKMTAAHDLAKDLGTSAAYERDRESELIGQEIRMLQQQRSDMEKDLGNASLSFMLTKQQLEDPNRIETLVDKAMEEDPTMQTLKAQLSAVEYQLNAMQSSAGGSNARGLQQAQQQYVDIKRQVENYRKQKKRQMSLEMQKAPNYEMLAAQKAFQTRNLMIQSRIGSLDKQIDEMKAILQAKGEKSVELDIKNAELNQLYKIRNDMALKLEGWEVEMEAPKRISLVQPATATPGIDSYMRYAIATIGGLAGFALTCFAVAYLEFRNRRLNSPDQVDEGLGIRVVGTLPLLSTRAALDPAHPILAQLTDSIDNVRTLLMHDSTSKARQVVLVTSAASGEGRTTVASQLAASLARAGRRTLLVDGDLRSPALHDLFEVPLEDGLCEVLRAEIDVADVVRPTHAEGLWLMTAGYCDVDAIHALATDQMQPIFEKLRGQYDFIIVDGPPVVGMSDSLLIGQYCDGAILSVLRDHSQVPKIYQAAELLRGVGVRIFGSVVNGMNGKSDNRVVQLRLMAPKSERAELQAT